MPGFLTLVTEDLPSQVLAHRLLAHIDPDARFTQSLGRRGVGYIASKLRSLNQAASGLKVVVLIDRDLPQNCPSNLIEAWLGGPRHANLVIRFAEMEIESWIMADGESLAAFLQVPLNRISQMPDLLNDPKQVLVNIARLSRNRRIREDMCPAEGASALVGPAYNSTLEIFLRQEWRPAHAILHSPSLRRAEQRIRELALR